MRELTTEEFSTRASDICGGNSEEIISVVGTGGGGYITFSTEWAAAFGFLSDNYYSDNITFDSDHFNIDASIDENGVYSIDTFIEDIDNLTAEERTQFAQALNALSLSFSTVVEDVERLGGNVSPDALNTMRGLAAGLSALSTAIDTGDVASKFYAGDFSSGTVAKALNIAASVAIGASLGGPVGVVASVVSAVFGEDMIKFALDSAVEAGELTVQQYNEVINNISLEASASGVDFGDIDYWRALFGIPVTGVFNE